MVSVNFTQAMPITTPCCIETVIVCLQLEEVLLFVVRKHGECDGHIGTKVAPITFVFEYLYS